MRLACPALIASSLAAIVLGISACESPVQDEAIASLGDEVPDVPTGPFHRYGQDCMACHGGYGPGPQFAVAGTVFATREDDIPVDGATIVLTDAIGQTVTAKTNCAGNFFVDTRKFEPEYPMRAEVVCPLPDGTTRRVVMGTRINREGGCTFCHAVGGPSSTSPGQVYCLESQPDPPFVVPPSDKGGQCEGGPSHGSAQ